MEQILFCRNTLSASYAADVILQQKQMEAALVSFNDSLGHNYYRFPTIDFVFDRAATIELTARTRSPTSKRLVWTNGGDT
jgi:hypothetical protein